MQPKFSLIFFMMMLFFAVFSCRGQSYYFRHYQAVDGLAHNSVTSIIQDKNGLMWIGTRGGLNRFDGYTFKACKNKNNEFGYIGNNIINHMVEDKNGMLWIASGKGVFKYDPYKEIFIPLKEAPLVYINDILTDHQNNIFFLANRKLYQYLQQENKIIDLKTNAHCLALGDQDILWLGNDDGQILKYNIRDKSITKTRIIDLKTPANFRSISKICPTKNNELLIGCFKKGLKSYNSKTGRIRSLPLHNSSNIDIYVRDITEARDNEYWVATESGIYIYNTTTNTSLNLRKQIGDPYSLADNAVYTVTRDRQGGMWAGTFFGGLNYYSKENARFRKYYPLAGTNSISGSAVREICPDYKGNLWIGTEDAGFNKFNPKTEIFTNYTSTGKKEDVSYPNIHGLLAVDHQLYIGPFLHGMEIMDMNTGVIKDRFALIGDKKDQTSDFVLSIYMTRDSTLLVGTGYNGSGLFTYDRKHKKFARVPHIPYNSYVFDIREDQQGNIWTGSISGGAYYYHPKTGAHGNIRFGNTTGNKTSPEFPVYGILEDSDRALWFTTAGGGMYRVSPDKKHIKKFSTNNGLPSNILFRMLEDDSKHLWISSLKGLIRFDMRTEKFEVYTQANGLITDQFNYNSAYKDPSGKMYFGSVQGMIAFDPKAFGQKETASPTYITGFQVNNQEIMPDTEDSPLSKSILHTDTIILPHDQNNFSIEFAALNYASPEVTRYEYLMHGLDENRTYLSSNRKAYFTDLSAGDYTFIVQAKSNTGSWTGKERHLFIRILPSFWKSYTAFFGYLFILITALFLITRYYHLYLQRRNENKLQLFEHEKEKEIYQSKIEFFTNIAHEIQTPLTLIVGPVEQMILDTPKESGIRRSLLRVEKNAKRLADLTSQLLDFRKTEMHQFGLNFVNTDINRLLDEQVALFRPEAEKNRISLQLDLPESQVTVFADIEALTKICNNLISNAIKYATSTAKVSLSNVETTDGYFSIRVNNDGAGIPEEFRDKIFEPFFRLYGSDKPGTGIGLSLAKSLAELHHGSLKLISGNTNTIVFELTLPVRQKIEFKLSSWKKIT